jgi:hypothetical protein
MGEFCNSYSFPGQLLSDEIVNLLRLYQISDFDVNLVESIWDDGYVRIVLPEE